MSGDPFPKEQQIARGERRYTRKVASPKRWAQIIDAKGGPCRIPGCGETIVDFHHLVARAVGGSDCESNIVPLCRLHHHLVTCRDKQACAQLRAALTDAEYAYAVETLGESRFEDRYPVEWKWS
jgi:hypothetical protein